MTVSTSGKMGVDYTATYASSDAPFTPGQLDMGADSTVWKFVRASTAVAQFQYVTIDEDHLAIPGTQAAVIDGHGVGFAQSAIAVNQYGWVAVSGSNIKHNTLKSCAADADLFATGSAGFLDDAVSSGHLIAGVKATAAATSGAGGEAVEIIALWARPGSTNQIG